MRSSRLQSALIYLFCVLQLTPWLLWTQAAGFADFSGFKNSSALRLGSSSLNHAEAFAARVAASSQTVSPGFRLHLGFFPTQSQIRSWKLWLQHFFPPALGLGWFGQSAKQTAGRELHAEAERKLRDKPGFHTEPVDRRETRLQNV
jgi:hypothetical protein